MPVPSAPLPDSDRAQFQVVKENKNKDHREDGGRVGFEGKKLESDQKHYSENGALLHSSNLFVWGGEGMGGGEPYL